MHKVKIWLKAFRLRTLPLAFSCTVTGTFLAAADDVFRWYILALTLLTTLLLQILSNLANDYGDAVSGADNTSRVGPQRVTHSGMVSRSEMKTMIIIFSMASLLSGIALIIIGLWGAPLLDKLLFAGFGVLAVIAALRYTLGKNPYGYRGFGDIYVFIFFGLLGVVGSYYMQTQVFSPLILLPATSTGLFSTGVLNLNNLRDEESDRESGKRTIVVIFGARFAKRYHTFLIITGLVAALMYTVFSASGWYNFLWLLVLPVFLGGIVRVWRAGEPSGLISELQRLAMATFLFSLFFGVTQIL